MNINDYSHLLMRHHEVDREMEEHFRRRDPEDMETRSRLSRPCKSDVKRETMLRMKSPKIDPGAEDLAPNGEHEAATGDPEIDRLLAELQSEPIPKRSSRVSASCARPVTAASLADSSACDSAEKAKTDSPAGGTPALEPGGPIARVDTLTLETVGLDQFPVTNLGDVPEVDDPGHELAALFRELVIHKNYPAVRTRCCQLSIRMNLRGAVAPAFRDWPRGVALFRSKIITLITRDQMVIDSHWCHASGMLLSPTDDAYKHLFNLDTAFDFKMAWQLSGKLHKSEYRADEALCLTPLQQCQTIQLHGRELHERMDRMYKGYLKSGAKSHSELAKATSAIGRWIENDPRIKQHRVSYLRLWQARELLGPGASKRSIAKLHALMLGAQPLDPKTIADKLSRLSMNVDITLKPVKTP